MYQDTSYNLLNIGYIEDKHKSTSFLSAVFDINEELTVDSYIEFKIKNDLLKDIKRILKIYDVAAISISNFIGALSEEIIKLENEVIFSGTTKGQYDFASINAVEQFALDFFSVPEFYKKKFLFENMMDYPEIFSVKKFVFDRYESMDLIKEDKKKILNLFVFNIFKPLLYKLNSSQNFQLTCINGIIEPDVIVLSKEDLNSINEKCIDIFKTFIDNLYFNSYWRSINQRVLLRYK